MLETYLLGLQSEDDKEYVKQQILTDSRVADQVTAIEHGMMRYFNGNAVSPPEDLREIVQLRSTKIDIRKEKHNFRRAAAEEPQKKNEYLDIEVNETYIKVHKYWRPAFIAVFVLSKIFLIAGLYYYFKTTNLQQEIIRLKTEINLKK